MNDKRITTSKRLILNTIFNVSILITTTAIGFFLVPFFTRTLGKEIYGIWIIVGSVFAYRNILSIGLSSAINRYIPVYLAADNKDGIERVINTSLCFFSCAALVLLVATGIVYLNISTWFSIPAELIRTSQILVLVVGACFAVSMPLQVYTAVLSGFQRYDIINLGIFIPTVLRAVLLVVLLSHGFGLVTVGLLSGGCELAIKIFQILFARNLLKGISFSLMRVDFALFKEMLAYGLNTFLYTMGAIIVYKSSHIIIGLFLSTTYVTHYFIATAALLLLSQVVKSFVAAIKPAVSDLDASNDQEKVREISFLSQKYSLFLLIPSIAFLVIMGPEFLRIWVDEESGGLSVILTILTFGHFLWLAQYSNFLVLVGKGEHKVFGILTVIMAVVGVILTVISIGIFKMGLIGVAWSNFLPMFLVSGLILPIYFNRRMNISLKESILEIWWPALLGSLPTVAMISVWKYMYPPTCWFTIAMVVLAAVLLTALGSWFFSFSELERKRFLNILVPSRARG